MRGIEDGTLYVVGGVPTPDRVDGLFASSFNIDAISSLNIITGNIPAEYGNRAGAVVLIQPKSGLDSPLNGTLAWAEAATIQAGVHHAGRRHQQVGPILRRCRSSIRSFS